VLRIYTPVWSSFDWRAGLIGAIAAWLLFRARWSVTRVLAVAALGGIALDLAI